MAALIIISIVGAAAGVVLGAYLRICFAIRREDRTKGSLRLNAPDQSARSARNLVGISSSKWNLGELPQDCLPSLGGRQAARVLAVEGTARTREKVPYAHRTAGHRGPAAHLARWPRKGTGTKMNSVQQRGNELRGAKRERPRR
jgi:hypothetical protein